MAEFLAELELAATIKDILSGSDVRCAVAYWGSGIDKAFPPSPRPPAARIICDVTMGGTSPKALIDLGATTNKNLRHVPNLHAKVYISSRGAVVGSANASSNGIGLVAVPGLIEAGTFVVCGSAAYDAATLWFEALWKRSKKIDKAALDIATKRFRPRGVPGAFSPRPGSLLDQIVVDPDRFSEISIVLAQTESKPKHRAKVRLAMIAECPEERASIMGLPDSGMFIGWDREDLARWRRTFIEFWMPKNRLYCYGRKASYFHDETGTVMSVRNWRTVKSVIDGELPDPAAISKSDRDRVRLLLDEYDNVIFSAHELAAALDRLD